MDTPGRVVIQFRAGTTQEFRRATPTVEHGALVIRERPNRHEAARHHGYPLDLITSWRYEAEQVAPTAPPRLPGDL